MGVQREITMSQLPGFLQQIGAEVVNFDMPRVWKQTGVALENGARDCFNSSKSPSNQPWSPLRHARPRGGNKPLLDRGLLRASLTNGGKDHIERTNANSMEWGTNSEAAALQNYGGVIIPRKGKFITIPASVEAVRAGSPRNFPDAKKRLKWAINRKTGDAGIVYEIVGGKNKSKRISGGSGSGGKSSAKRKSSKFMKGVRRGIKRAKKFGKKLKRFGKGAMKLIRQSASKIKKLSKKLYQMQKRLRSMKSGTKAAITLFKAITATKKSLNAAKDKHQQLKRTKNAKIVKTGPNKIMMGNKLIHYFLTKRVEVPAREFMGISENTADVIGDIFLDEAGRNFDRKFGSG